MRYNSTAAGRARTWRSNALSVHARRLERELHPPLCRFEGCENTALGRKWYCGNHRSRPRKSTNARDYGAAHQRLRQEVATAIVAGWRPTCSRCHNPIEPWDEFDLDHSDDRTHYLGPAHRRCNRAAAARKKNRRSQ